jgi:hypothetical protein
MDTENNQVCIPKKNIDDIEERIKNAMINLQEVINNKDKIEKEKQDAMLKLEEVINNKGIIEESLKDLTNKVEIIKLDDLKVLSKSKKILEDRLNKCLDEQSKNIIIARRSYHNINNKYWWASIFILVFSSIITFIEAVRLIIENTENKKIKELTYIISISSIFIGILITIVTGYIKFNDYQNKLEIISSRLSLLLQYQKKFEVIKFQLSIYTLPTLDNDKDTIQCTKHNILSKELLKEFSNSLNKLEEDIQNNELLKYITDSCEVRYYREYVDTYIKDMMYNHYIKTLTEYLNNNESLENDNTEKIFERISKIVNNPGNNKKKIKMDFDLLKELKNNQFSIRKNNSK